MFLCPANVVFICETPTNSLKKMPKTKHFTITSKTSKLLAIFGVSTEFKLRKHEKDYHSHRRILLVRKKHDGQGSGP